ncbi:SlyX family protein [Candidatus Schmidhempelia bombi]|uniref:Protein SlyX homolog n=1 Tax=Candidatus Schmidhempelia bombi str. Bimp TaxID=1387197 RepID=A0AB94IB92_9GAMM|nr:SlyX family protein [Candidatus Schmidhempelia bombi]TEA26674.1 SlyX family protein [Candidatus Schmidhempelia bombi str. Bimp]
MTNANINLQQRIEMLETKLAFQEVTIEQLNQMVIILQHESASLSEKLRLLSEKIKTGQLSNIASLSEEIPPPHY